MEINQLKYYIKLKTIIEYTDNKKINNIDEDRIKRIKESIKKIENMSHTITPRQVD